MGIWEVQVLGDCQARYGELQITRFPTRPVALLLARLAMFPERRHTREELIELLWPGVESGAGRNRLRNALSTLRRLLEIPGEVFPIVQADRLCIAAGPGVFECDASRFEQLVLSGRYREALLLWQGSFLPGFDGEWVEETREQLEALRDRAAACAISPLPRERLSPVSASVATSHDRRQATSRLPGALDQFIGRDREVRSLRRQAAGSPLITLAGPGGIGKSRLALELARELPLDRLVAHVSLGACRNAVEFVRQACRTLGVNASKQDPLESLCTFLQDRPALLILDSFEHLAPRATPALLNLVKRLPKLALVVTSRRILGVAGERVHVVSPLPIPNQDARLDEARRNPSVALFVSRARASRPDFAVTGRNLRDVVALARRLEGVPLAIEIAASKVRTLSIADILAGMESPLSLLVRPNRRTRLEDRHSSLASTLAWSWRLLNRHDREALCALTTFQDGWTVDEARALIGSRRVQATLERLVDDSLVMTRVRTPGVVEFSMLDMVREFASKHLGDAAPSLRERHRRLFIRAASRAAAEDRPLDGTALANVRHALMTAYRDKKPEMTLKLFIALRPTLEARGPGEIDEKWVTSAWKVSLSRNRTLVGWARLLWAQILVSAGNPARAMTEAREVLKAAGRDRPLHCAALTTLAHARWERVQDAARVLPLLDSAQSVMPNDCDALVQADLTRVRATVLLRHGAEGSDFASALRLFKAAGRLYAKAGRKAWRQRMRLSEAGCLIGLGQHEAARALISQCEAFFRASDLLVDRIATANMLGYLESGRANWGAAMEAARQCLRIALDQRAYLWLALAIWNVCEPLSRLGHHKLVAKLVPFISLHWSRQIGALSPADEEVVNRLSREASQALGERLAAELRREGKRLTLEAAALLALQQEGSGAGQPSPTSASGARC